LKDWAEHIGSAWRYLGLAWKDARDPVEEQPKPKELEYLATATGVVGNMSVKDAVEAMVKRRRERD